MLDAIIALVYVALFLAAATLVTSCPTLSAVLTCLLLCTFVVRVIVRG